MSIVFPPTGSETWSRVQQPLGANRCLIQPLRGSLGWTLSGDDHDESSEDDGDDGDDIS